MRALLLCGLLAAAPACDAADPPLQDFRKPLGPGATLVGMDCDQAAGTLELAYFHPSSPPARQMELWKTGDMVTIDRDQWLVTDERPLERSCRIGRDEYRVRFEPVPGNIHVMGICGAVTFARAKVWKNDALVFDDDFDKCEADAIIRSVRFEHATDVPKILREKTP